MGKKGRKSCNPGRKSCNLNDLSAKVALAYKKDEIEKEIKEKALKVRAMAHIRDIIRESKSGNGNGGADNLNEE